VTLHLLRVYRGKELLLQARSTDGNSRQARGLGLSGVAYLTHVPSGLSAP
jgi:hypothetical protein